MQILHYLGRSSFVREESGVFLGIAKTNSLWERKADSAPRPDPIDPRSLFPFLGPLFNEVACQDLGGEERVEGATMLLKHFFGGSRLKPSNSVSTIVIKQSSNREVCQAI